MPKVELGKWVDVPIVLLSSGLGEQRVKWKQLNNASNPPIHTDTHGNSLMNECMTFALVTSAIIKPHPNPNPNPNPYTTLIQSQMITLAITLCCRRFHRRSNCRQSKCLITISSLGRWISFLYKLVSSKLQILIWKDTIFPIHYSVILLLSYQCFHNLAPSFLTELLTIYKPGRNLRSGKNFFCSTFWGFCPH